MDKFYRLERYLKTKNEESFTMTFNEIESILGFGLSSSAYNYPGYWSPSPTHTLPNMILECGYKVSPNLKDRTIRFYKGLYSMEKPKIESNDKPIINNNGFNINGIEYCITRNPYTNGPMIARTDGIQIENRKEICRIFLRSQGWSEEMFGDRITNDLERQINKILNGNKPIINNIISNTSNQVKERKNTSKIAVENNTPKPTVEQVNYWLGKWDELEDYVAQEEAIDKLFYGEFKSNDNLQNILIKCSVLNDFYSTNIFKIYPVAKHILSLNVDKRLEENDVTLVDDIAKVKIGDSEKNFYSFASKYCSHHKPLEYPIYDSYVEKVLIHFNKVYRFYSFHKNDLKNYSEFKTILIKFREFFKLEEFNLKVLDKYLWQFGKYYFPKTYY